MHAEQITAACTHLGEGPVWDPSTGLLHWVDLLAGSVLTMAPPASHIARAQAGAVASAVRPTTTGGLVVAVQRGFAVLPAGAEEAVALPELWQDPTVRMNDGGCDPQGRFYAGSMAYDEAPGRGRLWRLDHDGTTTAVLDEVTISNGLAWSPDGHTAYYVDTGTGRVDAFDFDPVDGTFDGRRPVVWVPASAGKPDGLAVDADGRLWVALWGGSAVHCYGPNGRLQEIVDLPVRQVTACTFGGPGLEDLFITTAREGVADPEPSAGALFHIRPGAQGMPVQPFAGKLTA